MHRHLLLAAAASLSLVACSSESEADETAGGSTETTAPAATPEEQKLKAFQDSVEKAMGDIPPEHRDAFQKEFACEIERNNASSQPKEIDASTIREITARLKAGKAAGC
ncbi:hypothetical protein [Erythrobacter aureus]|uniref:Secreted protein n=1 Tax=Erythrobacter aureus TaxID=2182384 RepID=A0A345YJJ6_9SPHN|nr:hypothetical protein [Erythrobacter aureus]AXK44098.1 hypothetical protein DVR09_16735 [Erythrobacter aureus]